MSSASIAAMDIQKSYVIKYGFQRIFPGYSSEQSFKKGVGSFEAGYALDSSEIQDPTGTFITSKVVRQYIHTSIYVITCTILKLPPFILNYSIYLYK